MIHRPLVNNLIAIMWPPCSGKTTLAQKLAVTLPAVHIEIDHIRASIIPGSKSSETDRDVAYRAIHLMAEYLISAKNTVILDATYGRSEKRTELITCSKRAVTGLILIQFQISPEVACERFRKRAEGHLATDLDENRVRQLAERYTYDVTALIINGNSPVEISLRTILAHISLMGSR